jgi:hypothetical protein
MELFLGCVIGFCLVAIRVIWCHFDSKKMNKEKVGL